jgi:hypothetical protein
LQLEVGARYETKRGGINLVFGEHAPPTSDLSPWEIDSHILGVFCRINITGNGAMNHLVSALMTMAE